MQEHDDIYVQSNTLLQEDLFENFAINALKDMALILPTFLYFLILPKIRMQTCLKKTEVELGLGIVDRCSYAINGRGKYLSWNMSRNSLICKSQQQVSEKF